MRSLNDRKIGKQYFNIFSTSYWLMLWEYKNKIEFRNSQKVLILAGDKVRGLKKFTCDLNLALQMIIFIGKN